MYLIVVYDIEVPRINKVRALLRRYLFWVQNSVFEGEASDSAYAAMIKELLALIDEKIDSVIIYRLRSQDSAERTVLGIEKAMSDFVI
ncbi:MAG: CRISPR-associated endonuclease Cas2 [Candidatus Thorarchaeota archaeon]